MDLKTILDKGEDWATYVTSAPGVFVQKLPATKKLSARLSVNINPLGSNGSPSKKRGYTVRSQAEIVALRQTANDERVDKLLAMVAKANGGAVTMLTDQPIIEI